MVNLQGWKTIIVAVLSAATYVLGWDQLTQWVDPQTIAIVSSVLMAVMRFLTSTPLGKGR